MAVLDVVEHISKSIDEGRHTIGIFLDLSKTFDSTNHSKLRGKLHRYLHRGIAFTLISYYLSNRYHQVIGGTFSDLAFLTCGVPQGLVLGLLL